MKTEFVLSGDRGQNQVECVEKQVLWKVNRKDELVEERTKRKNK